MRRIEKQQSNFNVVPVIIALIAGAVITFFIKDRIDKTNTTEIKNVERLTTQADDLLSQFIRLQNLNERYAKMLGNEKLDSSDLQNLDSLNVSITNAHISFRQLLDSLQSQKSNYDKNSYILLLKITDAYIAALNQSNSINNTRNTVAIGNTNYNFDQSMLSAMQNALHEKQLEVIGLTSTNDKKIPSSEYTLMMKQQDSVITQVLQNQKQKNINQSDYSNKLQRDNERLNAELIALRQTNTSNQIKTQTTVSNTHLNEQLDLVKADCYLTRADARKIISNAKQRRDLLQQAQTILNALLQSSNPTTKEEAQQKLNELKTIAANNHD